MPQAESSSLSHFGVVGIGASAGGLESLERFFDSATRSLDVAYIVVQHLSPNYDTMMDQLLARHTAMPVAIAVDGEKILPNHVYVIPPKKDLSLKGGKLVLSDQDREEVPHLTIDRFFRSLAAQCGKRSAAIVLSGTGSDGSRGIKNVAEAGGLVIAESETTAKFFGMPRSAMSTGVVELTLPPESMMGPLSKHFGRDSDDDDNALHTGNELQQIFELMKGECRIDFRHYKGSTVSRRIDRRMSLSNVGSLADYADVLRNDREELKTLYQDMLIGVTKFFRDVPCFEYMQSEVIPGLIEKADPETGLRIWVAGCASGEEAYSLAIIVDEVQQHQGTSVDVKIFASDLHPASLSAAGAGYYESDALANVSPERLEKYFRSVDGGHQILPQLRERVVFAPHNVLDDPPFTGLDLITCRNLLIYFGNDAQQKALTLFHFGLKKDGVLFLGPSETVGNLANEFPALNERYKVYTKRRDAKLPADMRLPVSSKVQAATSLMERSSVRRSDAIKADRYDRLLDTVLPATLLIDDRRSIIESFGGAERYLRLPPRMISTDMLDLCPPDLRTPLSALFRRVQRSAEAARLPLSNVVIHDGNRCDVELSIMPLDPSENDEPLYAVQIITSVTSPMATIKAKPASDLINTSGSVRDWEHRVGILEDELTHSKENLQATIEELESSNEELQATNEELISSNEELQSTNEELNSVNEELHTVNTEFQSKNAELAELNSDMQHLFASTDIGTIFLDESLAVRRFTPRVASIFNLEPSDIGRKLSAFSHNLSIDDLQRRTVEVLGTGEVFEDEVSDEMDNHYFMRILPYRVDDDIAGVIMTLTNIDKLVDSRRMVEKVQRRLQNVIDSVPVFVSFVNARLEYEYVNEAYRKWLSIPPGQVEGTKVRDILGKDSFEVSRPHMEAALAGESQEFDSVIETPSGEMHVNVNYVPAKNSKGKVRGFYVSATDVTSIKRAEHELARAVEVAEEASRAKSDFLAKMSHEIRSPMTSILGFTDVLEKQIQNPDNQNCIDVIRRSSLHLLEIINDILDLSRIESGKMQLDEDVFSPAALLRECHNVVLPLAETKQVQLYIDSSSELDETVLGDHRRLRQIVLNLLTNAVKFAPEGEVVLRGEFLPPDSKMLITVTDNGCGIPEDVLPTLFEPFCQADNSDIRSHEGTGLGLTITKQLVQQMGGSLDVTSQVNFGSTFTVRLPWRTASGKDATKGYNVDLNAPLPRLDDRTILVIDDRRDIRFIVEHVLRDVGAEVASIDNGLDGVSMAGNPPAGIESFDCVVTDIQMPEMDGYETARRLRDRGFKGPILALSASAMQGDREKAIEAGCNDHIAKPIDKQKFIRKLSSLLAAVP